MGGLFIREALPVSGLRKSLAMCVGAAAATAITLLSVSDDSLLSPLEHPTAWAAKIVSMLPLIGFVSIPVYASWLIGLFSFGAAAWAIAEDHRAIGIGSAIALGAAIPFSISMGWSLFSGLLASRGTFESVGGVVLVKDGVRTLAGWFSSLEFDALQGLAGAVAGWIIWLIAYGKARS